MHSAIDANADLRIQRALALTGNTQRNTLLAEHPGCELEVLA